MATDDEHLKKIGLLAICIFLLLRILLNSVVRLVLHFLKELFVYSRYIFWQTYNAKDCLPPFSRLPLQSINSFLFIREALKCTKSHLFSVDPISWATRILFRKSLPELASLCVLPILSARSFRASDLTLRALLHLEWICMWAEREGSSFILLQVDIQSRRHHSLKILSLMCNFGIFEKKNQMAYDSVLSSIPPISECTAFCL